MAKSKATPNPEDDYQAQSDAETLAKAAEIEADPERHASAKGHLDKKNGAMQNASAQAESVQAQHADGQDDDTPQSTAQASGKINLRKKVKAGMAKAFPRD